MSSEGILFSPLKTNNSAQLRTMFDITGVTMMVIRTKLCCHFTIKFFLILINANCKISMKELESL